MRTSERKLYELEAEVRPNRYVAIALSVLACFIIVMLLMNEINVFKVEKPRMRIAVIGALLVLEIPQFAAGMDSGLQNPATKYLMIISAGIVTVILCAVLSFHATLIILLPVMLASQYPSRKISTLAVICSITAAVISPLISYISGTWDTDFLSWLCQVGGKSLVETSAGELMSKGASVREILLYLSLPHSMIVLALVPLSGSVAKNSELRLINQIRVLHMGESDALTGLLNRTSFEEAIEKEISSEDGDVAVVYVDANDLHRLNNEQGHNAGDRMLVCVAENLRDVFGDESVYRTGGDEFISIIRGMTFDDVRGRIADAVEEIEHHGYTVSVGCEYAQPPCTLKALIDSAEAKMMIDKERYHIVR